MNDASEGDELAESIADAMGAEGGTSVQSISIYIPNRDRHGKEIGNQREWVLKALDLLGEINGGATALPPCEGVWLNEDGDVIREHPVIVYSYIKPAPFLENRDRIRDFLHQMGTETNQGEVAFEFDHRFFRIEFPAE